MATYQAIAATGQAILGLLADACPKPEFAAARFDLYQIRDFQSPMEEGVSLFLYRISISGSRRTLPPTVRADGKRYRPPIPVDLHYVLTAWSKTAARQQRLLGWAVRALHDYPVLHESLLNHYGPEEEVFGPGETVELIFDTLSLQDLSNLWSEMKATPPLSVAYLTRMILLESTSELMDDAPVQTREVAFGKVNA